MHGRIGQLSKHLLLKVVSFGPRACSAVSASLRDTFLLQSTTSLLHLAEVLQNKLLSESQKQAY